MANYNSKGLIKLHSTEYQYMVSWYKPGIWNCKKQKFSKITSAGTQSTSIVISIPLLHWITVRYGWVWVGKWCIKNSGLILDMGSANDRRRYIVTSSFTDWSHTQNDICNCVLLGMDGICNECAQRTIYWQCFILIPVIESITCRITCGMK